MSETCDHSTESLPHRNKNDSRQNGSESLHTVAEGEPDENSTDDEGAEPGEGVVDLEDIGDMMVRMKKASTVNRRNGEKKKREMVTPEIRQSLSKQGRDILNCILLTSHISPSLLSLSLFLSLSLSLLSLSLSGYRIIGSHSGVKLCRWTKSMLRGRGGCYKHSFYGIESHRCMETTPSLACANKCVFCWR